MLKKQTLKKCILTAVQALLAIVILINVATALLSAADLRTRLNWMPIAALSVEGGSMDPQMQVGDLIIVGKRPYEELAVGDDVTFMTHDGLVTHRVVGVKDGELITKGLTNNINDLYTMSPDAYCGRVVARIPYLGYGVQLLTKSYLALSLCIIALFALCFGKPLVQRLREASSQEGKSPTRMPLRVLSCTAALSILLTMPYMTDAKYIGQVNRMELAVAQSLYFSSNYLDEGDGNSYTILGWNGKPYLFNLHIRNYDNELLYNREDVSVRYGIGVKKCTDEGYSVDYDIVIKPPKSLQTPDTTVTPLTSFAYPADWEGSITPHAAFEIKGGIKDRHEFQVIIQPQNGDALPVNTKIGFELYATTEEGKDYAIEMVGEFELTVAAKMDFIGQVQTQDLGSMLTFNVRTNLINEGSDEKILLFSWNPQFVYINEYESTAFNVINNDPNHEYYKKDQGRLWMKVQAFANINLEFFKRDVNLDPDGDGVNDIVPDYGITVIVVKEVGSTEQIEFGNGDNGAAGEDTGGA